MRNKKFDELSEYFNDLTIKKQMKLLAYKAAGSRLYYKEIMFEFEKTLLQELLEKYDYNQIKVAINIKLHRNTIKNKIEKLNIKDKKRVTKQKPKNKLN